MIKRVGQVGENVFLISGDMLVSGTLVRADHRIMLSEASVSRGAKTEAFEEFSIDRAMIDGVLFCESERGKVLHDFVLKVVFIDAV